MGYALRRWLRDLLGPDIKGLKRAIALEIADDARYDDQGGYQPETGRCSRVSLAELVRWTGAKDERTVREELRRLSLAGWEFRKPIGVGKDGRTLYAVPGRSMEFRVPEGPTPVVSEGPTTVASDDPGGPEGPTKVAEGPTTVAAETTTVASEATTVGPPSPVTPSLSSLSSSATGATQDERETDASQDKLTTAQRIVRASGIVAVEDEQQFIAWVRAKHPPAGPQFWRTVSENGDLPELAEAWRASRPAAAAPRQACTSSCDPVTFLITAPDGDMDPCPTCHPVGRRNAQRQGTAA